jgi:DNA-binding transcriptional MerR regulator
MDRQDNGQSIDEKVSVSVAAKALKVSTKTVHRYFERGLLTKAREGIRVYVLMDEIRALLSGQVKIDKSPRVHEKDRITVDRGHYDGLLTRLGQLEAKQELLLDFKADIKAKGKVLLEQTVLIKQKDKELDESKDKISAQNKILQQAGDKIRELQAKVNRLNKSWWQKLLGR